MKPLSVVIVENLPAILTSLGVLFTAIVGVITLLRTNGVHALVNSQFSQAKAEIKAALDEIAALKREIASRSDATTEERVRADVATEQAHAPLGLPRTPVP